MSNTAPLNLTVVEATRRVCRTCQHPIRLYASIHADTCCCCRHRCGLEVGDGCQVCGRLLTDNTLDAGLGVCARCQITDPVGGVQNPAPSTVKNTAGGDALGKIGAPRRHNESA